MIKETNAPPLKWRMARVHKLYPGSDGVSRVADVVTSKGIIRRAAHNLCLLSDAESTRSPEDFEREEHVQAE